MNDKDTERMHNLANGFRRLADRISNHAFVGGEGHFLEWHIWEEVEKLKAPRPPCGMKYHHITCTCNGEGGDR